MKNHSEGEAVNTTTPRADAQGVLIMQRVAQSLVAAEVRALSSCPAPTQTSATSRSARRC